MVFFLYIDSKQLQSRQTHKTRKARIREIQVFERMKSLGGGSGEGLVDCTMYIVVQCDVQYEWYLPKKFPNARFYLNLHIMGGSCAATVVSCDGLGCEGASERKFVNDNNNIYINYVVSISDYANK